MEKRTHHTGKGSHWSHEGECRPWCLTAYPDLPRGECSGRRCAWFDGLKKEAPK